MSLIDRMMKHEHPGNYLKEYEEFIKEYNPVDLGLGYPNYLPAKFVTDALSEVLTSGSADDHQYTNPQGHPRLRKIFSKLYSHHLNRNLDAEKEVLITAGSSEALFCAVMSLVTPGDEVIVIEPCFMVFVSLIKMAGGIPKFLSLTLNEKSELRSSADWELNKEKLEQMFTIKTKVIIVNTPHNPTGKVFDLEELSFIADLCKKWNVICIADEVYERMVFKPKTHIRIASLPDMFKRTITIGAAEKSFGVTGWQIGWAYGYLHLLEPLRILHQQVVFNASTPLQIAFARMFEEEYDKLDQPNSYFEGIEKDLREKRDFLVEVLSQTEMKPIVPEGGMFILADVTQMVSHIDMSAETDKFVDLKFVKWLTKKYRLLTFPVTIFCFENSKKLNENLVRFCFVKKQETLEDAKEIMKKL